MENQIKTKFFENIEFIGKKYFQFKKNKEKFSQRSLMKSLGYSRSGSSFISWKKGVIPNKNKLKDLCGKINKIIFTENNYIINLEPKDLLKNDLRVIIKSKKDNPFNDLLNSDFELNEKEKELITLMRLDSISFIILNNLRSILFKKIVEKDHKANEGLKLLAKFLLFCNP